MSAFFCKKLAFKISVSKKVPLLKAIVWELCLRFFSFVFSFCKTKSYYYWKHNFCWLCLQNPASRLLQIGQKPKKWQWRQNSLTRRQHQFFLCCFVSLVKFSYWCKFHVSIVTGFEIMTISFIREWPEIWKSEIPWSEFFPISGDWAKSWIPNLVQMFVIEC